MRSLTLAAVPLLAATALAPAVIAGCSASHDERMCTGTSGSALTVCATGPTTKGVDVSTYQGAVDWHAAKQGGIVFAFARVGDGLTHPDAQFSRNWAQMKAAGIMRGAYQFFRPGEDPVQQADLALSTIAQAGGLEAGDLPVVMDMEVTDGQSNGVIQANMKAWLDRVEQGIGRRPLIYTAPFMSSAVGSGFGAYPLWVANYGVSCPTMPANFTAWKFWQSSSTGTVAGISGGVDVDEFDGTLTDLRAFAGGPTTADAGGHPGDAGTAHDAGGASGDAGEPGDAGSALGAGNDAGHATPDPEPTASPPCGF